MHDGRRRPVLLDLFCGAGGAATGYHRAGFDPVGVDVRPQPRYPFRFVLADALEFTTRPGLVFDAVHASPPCQHYSDLAGRNGNAHEHPDLVGPVRETLRSLDVPWVIENVEGAPLVDPVRLCGTTFPELAVIRHRGFETSFPVDPRPCPGRHPLVFTRDRRKAHYGRLAEATSFVSVNGGGNCSVVRAREAMGIDWMTKAELNEAVPPAYTEYIGAFLMTAVRRGAGRLPTSVGR